MAYIDATFMEQAFDITNRERKPNVHHNGQADDLGLFL